MRTIEQHEGIIATQANDISKTIIEKALNFGFPYQWNESYWKGYCDALDNEGELFRHVRIIVLEDLDELNGRKPLL